MTATVDAIQRLVAAEFGVTVLDLTSARQGNSIAIARHAAVYLARHCTTLSLPQIGRLFGRRDHTTVLYGVRRIEELVESDPAWADRMARLAKIVSGARGMHNPIRGEEKEFIKRLWDDGVPAREISRRTGRDDSAINRLARRSLWKVRVPYQPLMRGANDNDIRALWEGSDLSASQIAAQLGLTKNQVIGVANRRGFAPRGTSGGGRRPEKPFRTFDERINALHAKLDAVLAENVGVGHRVASEKEDVRLLDRTGWKPTWGHPRERRAR